MTLPAVESEQRIRALLTLYRESHYDVHLARSRVATLRVGAPAPPAVARWIAAPRIGYYLTACNPRSQSLPPEENEERLEALRAELRERGAAFLEGAGHIPGEAWREPSLLVRGIADDDVAALVRRHDQNCIVVAHTDAPTTLRVFRNDWRALVGDAPHVEWG